jgi:hypothetical protein
MAGFNLECLVLRGVAVLSDGSAVRVRLGTGYPAEDQPPASLSMRHPSPGWAQGFDKPDGQRPNHADQSRVPGAANGAGRSRSRAGLLRRSTAIGGPKPMAATTLRPCRTWLRPAGGEAIAASRRGITIR